MAIARDPTQSPSLVIKSTEGFNVDQWQSLNINQFVPEVLQQVIDTITEIVDTIKAVVDLAIDVAKLIAALTSDLFNILKAILTAIADTIKSLLDLLPTVDAGIYLLWIPTEFGGVDYFTKTYKSSLADFNDLRRPPQEAFIPMRTMVFMWGAPWYDEERKKEILQIGTNFKKLFSIENENSSFEVPSPINFSAEKGFFTKALTSSETVTNTVQLPDNTIIAGAKNEIRTSIQKITRTSGTPGVSVSLTWEVPKDYGAFSREKTKYFYDFQANQDNTETHSFMRIKTKLVGIDIVRAESLKQCENAKQRMKNKDDNPFSFNGSFGYDSIDAPFVDGTQIFHRDLSSAPGSDFTIDFPPEPDEKDYFYAASYVYQLDYTLVIGTKEADGGISVHHVKNFALGDAKLVNSELPGALDDVNFANVNPKDVKYPLPDNPNTRSLVSEPTGSVIITRTGAIAPSGGAAPDWISFKGLGDLLPEIQEFIDKAKKIIDNILAGMLDDSTALLTWILEQIESFTDLLNDVKELTDLLNSLLFPPMLGVHYLNINTTNGGMPNLIARYERAIADGLKTENGAFNPLLLDNGFQDANPEEYRRRVHIPAYDQDHLTGGFVLAFQEPAIAFFLENLLGIGILSNFTDQFQQYLVDSRLRIKNTKLPELREINRRTHPFVKLNRTNTPDDLMNQLSDYKSGADKKDDPMNADDNVEMKSEAGPFLNDGPPIQFTLTCQDTFDSLPESHSFIIPHGTITAEGIVGLLACGANALDDGSFVVASKYLSIPPCSAEAARLIGLDPTVTVEATNPDIQFEGDSFEYSDGDYLVEFVNNGRPTTDMKKGVPAIFQLNEFSDSLLGPSANTIEIGVEGDIQQIDVTGNLGTNDIKAPALFTYTATFPITVETGINDQFYMEVSNAPAIELIPPGPQLITLRPLTYRNIHDLSAEFLRALSDISENLTPPPVYNSIFPLGTFTTTPNIAEDGADLFIFEDWGINSTVTLNVTPGPNDFLASLLTYGTTIGKDTVPYLINDVVTRLNAAFTQDPFTHENNVIRIDGQIIGTGSTISVLSNRDTIQGIESAFVAESIFGSGNTLLVDQNIQGIGRPMTSFEYHMDVTTQDLCTKITNFDTLLTNIETIEYNVEIQDPNQDQEFVIEFV